MNEAKMRRRKLIDRILAAMLPSPAAGEATVAELDDLQRKRAALVRSYGLETLPMAQLERMARRIAGE